MYCGKPQFPKKKTLVFGSLDGALIIVWRWFWAYQLYNLKSMNLSDEIEKLTLFVYFKVELIDGIGSRYFHFFIMAKLQFSDKLVIQ